MSGLSLDMSNRGQAVEEPPVAVEFQVRIPLIKFSRVHHNLEFLRTRCACGMETTVSRLIRPLPLNNSRHRNLFVRKKSFGIDASI